MYADRMKQYKPGDKIWIRYVMEEVYEATIIRSLPQTGDDYYEFEMTRKGKTFRKRDHASYFIEAGNVNYLTEKGWKLVG